MKIRFLILVIAIFVFIGIFPRSAFAEQSQVNTSAESAVLYCSESGEFIFESNSNSKLPMASLTKVMTAVVVLENCDINSTVEISAESCGIEGSSIYLTRGEKLSVRDLLYALMLESANDAAVALALSVSPTVSDFVDIMNDTAERLSLSSTHFMNPHGLDSTDHYSTARDLALLFDYALKNEVFSQIVSTAKCYIPYKDQDNGRLLVNHNRLLTSYEGCIGGKTGYTKSSGRSLVSASKKNGITLIAVTINDRDDWNDHKAMFDYGFSILNTYDIVSDTALVNVHIITGTHDSLKAHITPIRAVLTNEMYNCLQPIYHLKRFYFAPIDKGEVIGSLLWYCGDQVVYRCDIVATESIDSIKYKRSFLNRLFAFLN